MFNSKIDIFKCDLRVVCGEIGAGKTSSVVASIVKDYRKVGKKRLKVTEQKVLQLRANGFCELESGKHIYYSDFPILLNKRKEIYTYEADFTKFGFKNPNFEIQYFQYGSIIVIDEADLKAYCRDSSKFNNYVLAFLKYIRHNRTTIILIVQDFSNLDKAIRGLTTELIYVSNLKNYKIFGHIFKTVWTQWKYPSYLKELLGKAPFSKQEKKLMREYSVINKVPITEPKYFIEEKKVKFWGNIYKHYNREIGFLYFLDGLIKYGLVMHKAFELSVEYVRAYVATHPLLPPDKVKKGYKGPKQEMAIQSPIRRNISTL